ncbi:hypothetical protein Tco_0480111, partial [Tanacetum coccineum]
KSFQRQPEFQASRHPGLTSLDQKLVDPQAPSLLPWVKLEENVLHHYLLSQAVRPVAFRTLSDKT